MAPKAWLVGAVVCGLGFWLLAGEERKAEPGNQATVTLTFRKRDVTTEDILAALDEVRLQVSPPTQ